MGDEGVEPFVVTDQTTQPAPEPGEFESPLIVGRLCVNEGAGVFEQRCRAEAEAVDVDHVTGGVGHRCQAGTDFLLGTIETSGQLRLGERAGCSGTVDQGCQPLGQCLVRVACPVALQAISQSHGQVTVTTGHDWQVSRDVAQPLLRDEDNA